MIEKTSQDKKGASYMIPMIVIGVIVLIIVIWLISSYNGFVTLRNKTEEAFSAMDVSLKKRYDLIPNYVETVKGYAKHEEQVLTEVTEARANVAGLKVDKEVLEDPALFEKYQQAQAQMTSALARLIAVSENYPDLKANEQFRELQVQLEGTENRIAVARNRYITSVQDFNAYSRQFPQVMTAKVIGMKTKENFKADQSAQTAPKVSFE